MCTSHWGGGHVSGLRHVFNLFIVWLFTGLWHGANWTFIIWGLYYFTLLLIEKKTNIIKKMGKLSHIYTLFFVIISWVIFRADNIGMAINYLGNMFGIKTVFIDQMALDYVNVIGLIIPIGIILSTPIIKNIWYKIKINESLKIYIKTIAVLIIFILSLLACISSTYNPFIYFNF